MNKLRVLMDKIRLWLMPGWTKQDKQEFNFLLPLFGLSTLGMVFMYGFSLYFQPMLRETGRLVLFTVLMLVHAVFHWTILRFGRNVRSAIAYIVIQGILAFIVVLVGNSASLSYGLFLGLIGEGVGFMGFTPLGIFALLFNLALSASSFAIVDSLESLQIWAVTALSLTLFVLIMITVIRRQMTAREQAQILLRDLEVAHRQLTEYAARVEELTLTNERQRMARELHDTLSQGLAGLILQLEAASAHLASSHPEKAQSILQQAMARARATLADARHAIRGLREMAVSKIDLLEAVREEVERFQSATGIPCALEQSPLPALPESIHEHAIRTVAEGLMNIARHARAKHAWLSIGLADDRLVVEIRDDGQGFEPALALGQSGHYGLLGMRERARLAGGSLQVESQAGRGTRLVLSLPLGGQEMDAK